LPEGPGGPGVPGARSGFRSRDGGGGGGGGIRCGLCAWTTPRVDVDGKAAFTGGGGVGGSGGGGFSGGDGNGRAVTGGVGGGMAAEDSIVPPSSFGTLQGGVCLARAGGAGF